VWRTASKINAAGTPYWTVPAQTVIPALLVTVIVLFAFTVKCILVVAGCPERDDDKSRQDVTTSTDGVNANHCDADVTDDVTDDVTATSSSWPSPLVAAGVVDVAAASSAEPLMVATGDDELGDSAAGTLGPADVDNVDEPGQCFIRHPNS